MEEAWVFVTRFGRLFKFFTSTQPNNNGCSNNYYFSLIIYALTNLSLLSPSYMRIGWEFFLSNISLHSKLIKSHILWSLRYWKKCLEVSGILILLEFTSFVAAKQSFYSNHFWLQGYKITFMMSDLSQLYWKKEWWCCIEIIITSFINIVTATVTAFI